MRIFNDHPASVGETYVEHLEVAASFGVTMILGGIACIIHGLVPALFVKTGSRTVRQLHDRMVSHRQRNPDSMPGFDYVI